METLNDMSITSVELRARREALGLSQYGLARALGNSQTMISLWEGGKRPVPGGLDAELAELEATRDALEDEVFNQLKEVATTSDAGSITKPIPDDEKEAQSLGYDTPAGIVRIATVRAANALRDEEGIVVRLVAVKE